MSFEHWIVLLLVVNCSRDVELMIKRNPCIDVFLFVLFDNYVHFVNYI